MQSTFIVLKKESYLGRKDLQRGNWFLEATLEREEKQREKLHVSLSIKGMEVSLFSS